MRDAPRLYLITDRRATGGRRLVDVVDAALSAVPRGAAWVQLREKDLEGAALYALASQLAPVVRARGGALLVNDRVDVARAAGADGVHLPESGMDVADVRALWPEAIVGASVHDVQRAAAAEAAGADLVLFGPVWDAPGKPGVGLDALADVGETALVHAVGGIDGPNRARQARLRGAAGVAFIRAIMAASDPAEAMRALFEAAR